MIVIHFFCSWQLVAGLTTTWQAIPQMFPVHGAATAFFQTKFWVLGGSTGDDQYDHTITDKGMFVQNNENVVFYSRDSRPFLTKKDVEVFLLNHQSFLVKLLNVLYKHSKSP